MHLQPVTDIRCLEGDDLSGEGVWVNFWRTGLGSIGQIPVASKDSKMRLSVKEDVRACQKRGKKSLFLTEIRP
jgi:hypothetical protein